jgi:hypothetical protein
MNSYQSVIYIFIALLTSGFTFILNGIMYIGGPPTHTVSTFNWKNRCKLKFFKSQSA